MSEHEPKAGVLGDLPSRVAELEFSLGTLSNAIEADVDALYDRAGAVRDDIAVISGNISDYEHRLESLENKVGSQEDRTERLLADNQSIRERLGGIEESKTHESYSKDHGLEAKVTAATRYLHDEVIRLQALTAELARQLSTANIEIGKLQGKVETIQCHTKLRQP